MFHSIFDPVFKQPLPAIIDTIAKQSPDKSFITVAKHCTSTEGANLVTWGDLARAIDRAAHWLDQNLVPVSENPIYSFVTHTFDIRYLIFGIAGMKTGRKTFLPSPLNSEEFNLHLITKLNIHTIVSDITIGSYAKKAGCTILQLPSLVELVAPGNYNVYPYKKTWEDVWNDEIIVVHSSGSTGPPKPVAWTHAFVECSRKLLEPNEYGPVLYEQMLTGPGMTLGALLMSHPGGLLAFMYICIFFGTHALMYPANAGLTAQSLCDTIETFRPRRVFSTAAVLEAIVNSESQLRALDGLHSFIFGGSGISEEAGQALIKHVPNTMSVIGSTESSLYHTSVPPVQDCYNWFRFAAKPGFVMEPQSDGQYELIFERTEDFDWSIFHTYPDKNVYRTNDLYEKHPTIADTCRTRGRTDDILVLTNGTKMVSPPMESVFRESPIVAGALYFGFGKPVVGLLVELEEQSRERLSNEQALEAIRPYIERVNTMAPAFAQLANDMIVFTSRDKPMRRAGKGSIIRKASIADYSDEVENLYSKVIQPYH